MFQNFALPYLKLPSFVCPTKISHLLFHVYLKRNRCSLGTIFSAANVSSSAIRIYNGRSGLIKDLFVVDIFITQIKFLKEVLLPIRPLTFHLNMQL